MIIIIHKVYAAQGTTGVKVSHFYPLHAEWKHAWNFKAVNIVDGWMVNKASLKLLLLSFIMFQIMEEV